MTRRTRMLACGVGLTVALVGAGAFGIVRSSSDRPPPPSGAAVAAVPAALSGRGGTTAASLEDVITSIQARLEAAPRDAVSWATLALAYVQQARVTVDPSYYPLAEGALEQSLEIDANENFLAHAGLSALAAARHDFIAAKEHAERGLEINAYSALLYGALSDAEIQLGNYEAGFAAVQRMVDLSPDTASLSRASYAWELRGDVERAAALMQRALDDAPTEADRAFALVQLGELRFSGGDPEGALTLFRQALVALPASPAALAGKARALAALGQRETALDDYAALVARAPEPSYLVEYGELLEATGRSAEAQEQYELVTATQQLLADNGVVADATFALFHADHGDPGVALSAAQAGMRTNPIIDMHDAYAWALHRNGRHEEALTVLDAAMSLGFRSARMRFHAGSIALALGDEERARVEFTTALQINPHFNPLQAEVARAALAELAGAA